VAHLYEIDELLATPTFRPGSIKNVHQGASKGDSKSQAPSNALVGGACERGGGVKGCSEEESEELMEGIGPLPIKNRREVRKKSHDLILYISVCIHDWMYVYA